MDELTATTLDNTYVVLRDPVETALELKFSMAYLAPGEHTGVLIYSERTKLLFYWKITE